MSLTQDRTLLLAAVTRARIKEIVMRIKEIVMRLSLVLFVLPCINALRWLKSVSCSLVTAGILGTTNVCNAVDPSYISRYELVKVDLQNLDNNWDAILAGEKKGESLSGDNVRRKLGTVYSASTGCTQSLCGFTNFQNKFIKEFGSDLSDYDSFETAASNLLESLNQADFLAYSAVFSDYGNGGGGQNYLDDSHTQVKKALKSVNDILIEIRK